MLCLGASSSSGVVMKCLYCLYFFFLSSCFQQQGSASEQTSDHMDVDELCHVIEDQLKDISTDAHDALIHDCMAGQIALQRAYSADCSLAVTAELERIFERADYSARLGTNKVLSANWERLFIGPGSVWRTEYSTQFWRLRVPVNGQKLYIERYARSNSTRHEVPVPIGEWCSENSERGMLLRNTIRMVVRTVERLCDKTIVGAL